MEALSFLIGRKISFQDFIVLTVLSHCIVNLINIRVSSPSYRGCCLVFEEVHNSNLPLYLFLLHPAFSHHGTDPPLLLPLSFTVLAWARPSTSLWAKDQPNAPPSLPWDADGSGASAVPPAAGRSVATASTALTWGSLVGLGAWRRAVLWDNV